MSDKSTSLNFIEAEVLIKEPKRKRSSVYIPKYDTDSFGKTNNEYSVLTIDTWNTLNFYRNVLISLARFKRGLAFLYFKEKKTPLFNKYGDPNVSTEEYNYAIVLFKKYIFSRLGFWVVFRDAKQQTGCETCIIIEENKEHFEGYNSGSNKCLCCGKDIPEGIQVCKQCEVAEMSSIPSNSKIKRCPMCKSINLSAEKHIEGTTTCLCCGFTEVHSAF